MSAPTYVWQPTTAAIARRAGIDPTRVIRFDHNTSPYPPPWADEMKVGDWVLNEYPAADYQPLREAIADYVGVTPRQVVPGAGADEMIFLAARALLGPGARAVAMTPTYPLYEIATLERHAIFDSIPRRPPDFDISIDEALAAAGDSEVVWMCVPNNPTGGRDSDAAVRAIINAAAGVVVIDAAYAEFVEDRWGPWVDQHPNLIVLGTMSKAFGLAAVRVGYAYSSVELAARLEAVRPPGSISTISAALATRALRESEQASDTVQRITLERQRLAAALQDIGFDVLPSVVNFLPVRMGPRAHEFESLLIDEGLVVRGFNESHPFADILRITVRRTDENDQLVAALQRIAS